MKLDSTDVAELTHSKLLEYSEKCATILKEKEKEIISIRVDLNRTNIAMKVAQTSVNRLQLKINKMEKQSLDDAIQIQELEKRLRMQHEEFIYQSTYKLDVQRLKFELATKATDLKWQNHNNDLSLLNHSLREDMKKRNAQFKNEKSKLIVRSVKRLKNRADVIKRAAGRYFGKINERHNFVTRVIQQKRTTEIRATRDLHLRNTRALMDTYNAEIEELKDEYDIEMDQLLDLAEILQTRLEEVTEDNHFLHKRKSIVQKKIKIHSDASQAYRKRNEFLERKNKSQDDCKRQLNSFHKELLSLRLRLKEVTYEKNFLEEENRKLKLGLEKYDEYHSKTITNMERKFSMNIKKLSLHETEKYDKPCSE